MLRLSRSDVLACGRRREDADCGRSDRAMKDFLEDTLLMRKCGWRVRGHASRETRILWLCVFEGFLKQIAPAGVPINHVST